MTLIEKEMLRTYEFGKVTMEKSEKMPKKNKKEN